MSEFSSRYGPFAIVTGAAAGVGLAYTEELLARGLGVVMVDIAADVGAVADGLDGETVAVQVDVTDPTWLEQAAAAAGDREIGLAVANAGLSFVGRYLDMTAQQRRAIIEVNCTATAELASWALPPMVDRGRGGFVATSSGSALAGTAGVALYSATKAFSVNLIEAIGWELKDSGVDLVALLAPSMDTPAFRSHEADHSRMAAPPVDPRSVVARALDALPSGGRFLGDPGLEFAAAVDRHDRVDMMSAATTGMYPQIFKG